MAHEPNEDDNVRITGKQRQHPAYRLLARAMLALAQMRPGRDRSLDTAQEQSKPPEEAGDG